MATLSVQAVTRSGVTPTKNAVSSADKFANDGKTIIHVTNGSGGALSVGVVTQSTVDGQAVSDLAIAVADSAEAVIGPFPKSIYNDSDGNCNLTFDATTSVTCQVLKTVE